MFLESGALCNFRGIRADIDAACLHFSTWCISGCCWVLHYLSVQRCVHLQAASLKDLFHLPGINHTRNGIIWCAALEIAYTAGAFALGVNDNSEYSLVLLDKSWESMQLREFGCPKTPTTIEVTPTPVLSCSVIDMHTLCVFISAGKGNNGCFMLNSCFIC